MAAPAPSAGAPNGISDGYVDPITQRYFYTGLGDSPVYFTDDRGKTWGTGTFDSTARQDWNKVFSGRPRVPRTTGYPTNTYYCNWSAPAGVVTPTVCYRSTDGGKTFVTAGPDVFSPQVCADPGEHPSPNHGRGVVDARDGTVYVAANVCGHQDLAVSKDEGRTWTHRVIGPSQTHVPEEQAFLDVAASAALQKQALAGRVNPVSAYLSGAENSDNLAIDSTGRLYAIWVALGSYLPYVSTSGDGGTTWSPAALVSPPGVQLTALPSINATATGRVGVSFMGSTDEGETFTGYLSVIDHLRDGAPVVQGAAVTRPGAPLMTDPCCWANGAEEYTAARWAPDGSLYAAFAGSRPSGDAEGFVGRLVRPSNGPASTAPVTRPVAPPAAAPTPASSQLPATGLDGLLPALASILLAAWAARAVRRRVRAG